MTPMTDPRDDAPGRGAGWRKAAALALGLCAVGLPVNHGGAYALLLLLAVAVFSGEVSARPRAWLGAAALVAVAVGGQFLLAPPRIEEGHNIFLPDAAALQRELPASVYRTMAGEFDATYPPGVRCPPPSLGCWRDGGRPDKAYAFSADSVWRRSAASRSVTALDFSDPGWLHLGFINEMKYNWYTAAPDVHRADRDRRFWAGLHRWHLTMPWFEMLRLPAAYAGGELCWRGDVLWEGEGARFTALPSAGCRTIATDDAGRRVFGIAIRPGTLAMHLAPPWRVWLERYAAAALALAGVIAIAFVLIRVRGRRAVAPLLLLGLSAIVIAVDDASFLGGVRPFDGGDDGLFYDSVGRDILQRFLAGDVYGALQGGENVFFYGGPGLRYFRALEHAIFGETYLGYLTLLLVLPFAALFLFRRFMPRRWALALALVFVAIPIGTLFGTSFIDYAKWASRGFADPAAYVLFIAGMAVVVGTSRTGPENRFAPAFFGALLLALGIAMKPIVAPAAAVLLGGSGLFTLYSRQLRRLAGLCLGFSPVFSMALHNWIYGHVFVLFSANAEHPFVYVMPPSAYVVAAQELIHLDFSGVGRILVQMAHWLSGPAETFAMVPVDAVAVIIVVYVVACGRQFDPWLRLIGASALGQHAVALFYIASIGRYHYLAWFLTMLVVVVWLHDVGVGWFVRRFPGAAAWLASRHWLSSAAVALARLERTTA
jgi:hypothetical protein